MFFHILTNQILKIRRCLSISKHFWTFSKNGGRLWQKIKGISDARRYCSSVGYWVKSKAYCLVLLTKTWIWRYYIEPNNLIKWNILFIYINYFFSFRGSFGHRWWIETSLSWWIASIMGGRWPCDQNTK
jgi:hypothetical protein